MAEGPGEGSQSTGAAVAQALSAAPNFFLSESWGWGPALVVASALEAQPTEAVDSAQGFC